MQELRVTAKSLQLCFFCFRQGRRFKVCASKYHCRHCNQPYNTLLRVQKSPLTKFHAKVKSQLNAAANKSKVKNSVVATLVHKNRPSTRLKFCLCL